VRFTGARPGEKLYEELFFGAEEAEATSHPKVLRSTQSVLNPGAIESLMFFVEQVAASPSDDQLYSQLSERVEGFRSESAVLSRLSFGN
jgi:FlaA1/EpsC-like NDP-sugar epimerase